MHDKFKTYANGLFSSVAGKIYTSSIIAGAKE